MHPRGAPQDCQEGIGTVVAPRKYQVQEGAAEMGSTRRAPEFVGSDVYGRDSFTRVRSFHVKAQKALVLTRRGLSIVPVQPATILARQTHELFRMVGWSSC